MEKTSTTFVAEAQWLLFLGGNYCIFLFNVKMLMQLRSGGTGACLDEHAICSINPSSISFPSHRQEHIVSSERIKEAA